MNRFVAALRVAALLSLQLPVYAQPAPPRPDYTDSQDVVVFVPAVPPMRTVWRPLTGLAIAGGVACFAGYSFDLAITGIFSSKDIKQAAIPLAGPWLQFNHDYKNDTVTKALLGIDGVVQAAGMAMLVIGMSVWRKEQRPAPAFTLAPFASPTSAGLQLVWQR